MPNRVNLDSGPIEFVPTDSDDREHGEKHGEGAEYEHPAFVATAHGDVPVAKI